MRIRFGNTIKNDRQTVELTGARATVRIGRTEDNEVVLNHPTIAPLAAALHLHDGAWELAVYGPTVVEVGQKKLHKGDRVAIADGTVVQLWPFSLTIDLPQEQALSGDQVRGNLDQEMGELVSAIHLELLRRMDLASRGTTQREDSAEYHLALEQNVEEIARLQKLFEPNRAALADHVAGLCLRQQTLESLLTRSASKETAAGSAHRHRLLSAVTEREQELTTMIRRCAEVLGLPAKTELTEQLGTIEKQFWSAWEKLGKNLFSEFKQYLALRQLKKDIKDIVFGYGPLEDLLRIPTITEIMVVDRDRIFVEKNGVLENSGRHFISDEVTLAIIERIVAGVGRRIDRSSPLVDARLTDGSRVNAVIPPLAVAGPCLTVRKFPGRKMTVADLLARGSLTPSAAKFLEALVLARKNILVSGGTGSGKTTLLNCLSDFIPDKERIITIEDTAELQLHKPHVVRLETKAANVEGAGAFTIRDLVKNALRMRPDRIVVGECRGPEALDMLQAMNSGHDGSMTTLHANTAADVVLRLEVLVQMAADLPVSSIHRQIASAVDVVVQLHRLRGGRRCVSQITEFADVDEEFGGVRTRDLFLLQGEGDDAVLAPTGALPTFMGELIEGGMLSLETFYQ